MINMSKRLEGRTALIMGAGTEGEGIGNGKAAAMQFAREGAKVLCADRSEAAARDTADAVKAEGGTAEAFQADVTDPEQCEAAVAHCVELWNGIGILHNNQGVACLQQIADASLEEWRRVFEVNSTGTFNSCRAVIPRMIENGGGSIINISTVASIRSFPDAAYTASKGAVNALTTHIAGRYGRYNIRANTLILGYIDTPLARPAWENEKIKKINLRQVPMRRFASPFEVATAAAFLASDEASYINGAAIPVDGGLTVSL